MVYIIYILTLTVTAVSFLYVLPVLDTIRDGSDEVELAATTIVSITGSVNLSEALLIGYSIAHDTVYAASVVLPFGPLVSFVACILLLIHMVGTVHVHLKKISIGDYDFLPARLASPTYRLVHSMQYMGYQVGYFTWAWIMLTIFVWLVGFVGLILYLLLKFYLGTTVRVGLSLVIPLLYSLVLYYLQLICTKIFFVGDTNNKHVVIKNLRLFHLVSYVLVFQNAVVGITSAFIRILYSILFGLLLMFRLDRVVLMKGFERFDKGHKTYIGFLYLEHTLNNAVLKLFAELLLEGVEKKRKEAVRAVRDDKATPLAVAQMEDWIDLSAKGTYPRVSQRALNRWGVAYTLINNPDLIRYTASKLAFKKTLAKEGKRLLLGDALSETSSMLGRPSSTQFTPTQPSPTPDQSSSVLGQCNSNNLPEVETPQQDLDSYGASFKENSERRRNADCTGTVPVKLRDGITRPELAGEAT